MPTPPRPTRLQLLLRGLPPGARARYARRLGPDYRHLTDNPPRPSGAA